MHMYHFVEICRLTLTLVTCHELFIVILTEKLVVIGTGGRGGAPRSCGRRYRRAASATRVGAHVAAVATLT